MSNPQHATTLGKIQRGKFSSHRLSVTVSQITSSHRQKQLRLFHRQLSQRIDRRLHKAEARPWLPIFPYFPESPEEKNLFSNGGERQNRQGLKSSHCQHWMAFLRYIHHRNNRPSLCSDPGQNEARA